MRYELDTHRIVMHVADEVGDGEPLNVGERVARLAWATLEGLDDDQEHFIGIATDTQLHPRAVKVLFSGGLSEVNVDLRVVWRWALLAGAHRVFFAHNHNSGGTDPSAADRKIAEALTEAGDLLGIEVVDHIIIGGRSWRSVAGAPSGEL